MRILLRSAVLAVIAVAAVWLYVHWDHLQAEHLAAWLGAFGLYAPALFLVARIVGAVVFVPGSIMAIAAGILFGPVWGAVYNLFGSTGGAVAAFAVARYAAAPWVTDRLADRTRLARLVEGVEAEGWRFVAFVRLVPLFPYNVLNYALGLTRIGLAPYTLASLICMVPGDLAYVYIGYASREAISGHQTSLRLALLALGLLACLAFLPRLIRAYRSRAF